MKKFFRKACTHLTIFTILTTMLTPSLTVFATATDTMAVGSYVQFGHYYGQPIVWRVINQDANGTMILMDKIISIKPFDAAEPTNTDADRQVYGSSNWSNSNLREWLNSNESPITYSTQAPDIAHVWGGRNPYNTEAGFLSNFSINEQNAINSVTHKYVITSADFALKDGGSAYHIYYSTNPSGAVRNYTSAYYKNTTDKVFPLSVKELNDYVYSNGALNDGATYYMAKPTADAISHANFTSGGFNTSSNWYYYLRDADTGTSYFTRSVIPTGSVDRNTPNLKYSGWGGLRAALYLKSGIFTSDGDGTSNNPYILGVPSATIKEVKDDANNNDASDIRVIFKGAADESKIASYKIIVALASGTQPTDSVNASLTTAATNTVIGNYMAEPKKGNKKIHLFMLPSKLQTYDGNTINATAGALKIYVLSIANTGYSDKLSAGADLTVGLATNNEGYRVTAQKPLVSDAANNNNGTDIKVTFKKPKSEANIAAYRIIVSTTNLTLATAASVPAAGYKQITPTTSGISYTVSMDAAQKIQDGTTAIQNGTVYKVYILAIGKNGYANVLSAPSRSITLSQYVPGVSVVGTLKATKVGSGHDSSNISVSFYEPTTVSNVQEYRIFIAPTANTLSQGVAEGISNASLYQVVATTGKGAYHTVTLNTGINDYTNAALAAGGYKVYVLTVGKNGYANKLSAASGSVTLN